MIITIISIALISIVFQFEKKKKLPLLLSLFFLFACIPHEGKSVYPHRIKSSLLEQQILFESDL